MADEASPSPQQQDGVKSAKVARPKNAATYKNGSRNASPSHKNGARWPKLRSYAAIDLGTNNCRLLVAKPSSDGFIVTDAFSRVVRLGEGLVETGRISNRAMDRAVAALSICADKLKRRNVTLARSVATEACRRASNGDKFIDRVRRETGIALDIITAEEEARLAVLGCQILLEPGEGPALIFDIGGGSTELVLVDTSGTAPEIIDWLSAPWGVVSLTESEKFNGNDAKSREQAFLNMRARVAESFAEFASRLPLSDNSDFRLLGTSGTVTTLASLHLKLPHYDRKVIDGLIVPTESMRDISAMLAACSPDERAAIPCIGKERADLVVGGCAILDAILDIWPASRVGVADRGIREGILRSLMSSNERRPKS